MRHALTLCMIHVRRVCQRSPGNFELLWEIKFSTINRSYDFKNRKCDWSIIPDTIIPHEEVVTEFLRNILTNFQFLSQQFVVKMDVKEKSSSACVAQLFCSIPSIRFKS